MSCSVFRTKRVHDFMDKIIGFPFVSFDRRDPKHKRVWDGWLNALSRLTVYRCVAREAQRDEVFL